jgi:hypothetical protein
MPNLTVPFDRLARLSNVMAWVTTVGIVLIVVLTTAAFFIPEWTRNLLLAKLGQPGASLPITPLTRALAAAVVAVPVGVMLYGLFAVRALFREFAEGRVFTVQAARHLQTFGASVLAQALLGPLTATALSLAMSLGNPPGQRAITVALSINDYFALVVGGALFAVATMMREAARLADENASFV